MKTVRSVFVRLRLLKDISAASPLRIPLELMSLLLSVLDSMIIRILLLKWILDFVVAREYRSALTCIIAGAIAELVVNSYDSWMVQVFRPRDTVRLHRFFQTRLYQKAVRIPIEYYDNPSYYEKFLLAAKNSDTEAVNMLSSLRNFLSSVLEIGISTGMVVAGAWQLLPIVLIPSTLYILASKHSADARVGMRKVLNTTEKKMGYVKRVFFTKGAAMDIRTTGLKRVLLSFLDHSCSEGIQEAKPYLRRRHVLLFVQVVLFYGMLIGTIVYLSWRSLVAHDISVGDFALLMNAGNQLANNWRFFGETVGELAEQGAMTAYYYEFLKIPEEETGNPLLLETYGKTELKDVRFAYPGSDREVFKDLSFSIRKGEAVAVVGQNGVGKTTLVNLLLGFYAPQKGEILQDDHKLSSADRGAFSMIFQDSRLYPFSVAENLLFHSPITEVEKEAVWKALYQVGLRDRIEKLPNGLDTQVTKEFSDEGVVLSGGEAQRLMLARSLLQSRAVTVMDEPTAAQDPKSEKELNEVFTILMKGRTILLITHRLSTLSGVDRICFMEDGKIIEEGSHDELMKKQGRYAQIYRKQAALYTLKEESEGSYNEA